MEWGKVSQTSNISQITKKDQKIDRNLQVDRQITNELYASQVTDKTIELTPAFK